MPSLTTIRFTSQKKTKQPKERDEAARLSWQIKVRDINAHQLIFADESACYLNMRSNYARSPKGQAAYSQEAYRPEGKVNLLACMSLEGVIAPWLVEGGSVDTGVFHYYVEHILSPQLREGQILVLDNYAVHKAEVVARSVAERDCKLMFLPTYSPDLNPIELLFAKLKRYLKTVPTQAFDALSTAIHDCFKHVALSDLIGWFRHAGYVVY